jgi:large subunit ribosomal protein L18
MASGPRYSVKYRRRREGKTDYRSRLALVKSRKPRMVVRKTSTNIIVQFITYAPEGDKVVGTALSRELTTLGWKYSTKSIPAAYLTGYLASKRVAGKVSEAVLDIGLSGPRKGAKIFAALKGALDGGIKIPHGKEIFPSDDRIKGKHIEDYRQQPIMADFAAMKGTIDKLKAGKVEKVPKVKGAPKPTAPVHKPVTPPSKPVVQAPRPVSPPPKPVVQAPKPVTPPKPVDKKPPMDDAPPPKPVVQAPKPVAPPPKPVVQAPKPVTPPKPVDKKPPMDDMDALLAELTGKKATPPPAKPAAVPAKPADTSKPNIDELLSKKKKDEEKKEP